jgi:hypothetical protein
MQILDIQVDHDEVESIAATPTGALVGLRHFDADYNAVWSVLRLDADAAPMAPKVPLLTSHSSGSTGPIEIAVGPSSAGAILWDLDHGCSFVPLALDGTPTNMPIPIGFTWCQSLLATDQGFTFFAGDNGPWSLVAVDASGGNLTAQAMPQLSGTELRVGLPDHSFMAMWAYEGIECSDCPLHMRAQRFAANGEAIGTAHEVFGDDKFGSASDLDHVALVPTATGFLAGWSPTNQGALATGALHVVPFDSDATQPSQVIAPPDGTPLEGLALAEVTGGDVVAAWLTRDGQSQSTVHARALSPKGVPYSDAVYVMSGPVAGGFTAARLAPTPSGAIVVAQAGGLAAAAALTCVP